MCNPLHVKLVNGWKIDTCNLPVLVQVKVARNGFTKIFLV
jgi:hypothetical protein